MSYVKAKSIIADAAARGVWLAAAESCTGGLVAAALTDVPGASKVFDRGLVTYSNAAKTELLGVSPQTLAEFGAVSAQTAAAMAEGAIARSRADIAVSITGVAGPDGGSNAKPVGLVYFACARRGGATTGLERRFGPLSRAEIRAAAVVQALDLFEAALALP